MPTTVPNANDFIEQQLDSCIRALEEELAADVLGFSGPLIGGVDDVIRIAVEAKFLEVPKRTKLCVLVTSNGGYIEVVHRIVDTFRNHYATVDFIVPNSAFSAGTILVMSGDAIHMDYYSRLGPIDPQVETDSGAMVSALGYLAQYQRLLKKATNGTITTAEMQILLEFDQGELYQYEQARDLSIALLKEWLVKYKFKNWKVTETRKIKVTSKRKIDRAASIARILNDTRRWHSHGYGISKDVLDKDLNLLIDDFGKNKKLSGCIRQYHDLLTDYMIKRSQLGVVHFAGHYRPFMMAHHLEE